MFSASPKTSTDDEDGVDPAEFQRYFQQHGRFTAGTATRYSPGLLVADATHQHLAAGFEIGTRFHSAPVVRLADARPLHLGHVVEADGRWRLFAFADDRSPDERGSRLRSLCDFLATDPRSPMVRYTGIDADPDGVLDLRAILQQDHQNLTIADMPTSLRRTRGGTGSSTTRRCSAPT